MIEDNLGFIAASPAEAASVARYCRRVGARHARVATFGIGPNAATEAANSLVAEGVTLLISWGTAGGLEAGLAPGTLILGQAVVCASDGREYCCDPAATLWLARNLEPLTPVLKRGVSSVDAAVDGATKSQLNQRYDGAFVDMESAAIGAVAQAAGIGFAIVRVIVDPARFSLPISALAGLGPSEGQTRRTLSALCHHPSECGAMLRLGAWYFRALRRLSQAARLLFKKLG
ncbi:MAG: hypothetical protein EXR86_11915 [Gammaproteobacteria bacterium]|nr:hypothetical protein [Gammaproteobacteria bacterium]